MRDVETNSAPNKNVCEGGTLIEEANEAKFVNQNGNINMAINKTNSAMPFFGLVPSYGQKSCDKTNKMLSLSQYQQDQTNTKQFAKRASMYKMYSPKISIMHTIKLLFLLFLRNQMKFCNLSEKDYFKAV